MKEEESAKHPLTPLSELGEFGLIDRLTHGLPHYHEESIRGVGDDTAVIDSGDGLMLLTKDLLVEGTHFDMVYTPLKHLGYKAVTVNLSDIFAMNGTPLQILVGLGVPPRYSVEALDELYAGIRLACEKYRVDLVGGDTVHSPAGLIVSVTASGRVAKDRVVYRSGAAVNDILCVSGDLGAAYCGLLILQREKQAFKANPQMQPQIHAYSYLLQRQLKPEAQQASIAALEQAGVLPTAMIDVSDGLASEVMHLCKQSGLGAVLYEEKIPIHQQTADAAREFGLNPLSCALNGGEDYELLFALSPSDYARIEHLPGITPVGHMTDASAGQQLLTTAGQQIPLQAQGWNAFKARD